MGERVGHAPENCRTDIPAIFGVTGSGNPKIKLLEVLLGTRGDWQVSHVSPRRLEETNFNGLVRADHIALLKSIQPLDFSRGIAKEGVDTGIDPLDVIANLYTRQIVDSSLTAVSVEERDTLRGNIYRRLYDQGSGSMGLYATDVKVRVENYSGSIYEELFKPDVSSEIALSESLSRYLTCECYGSDCLRIRVRTGMAALLFRWSRTSDGMRFQNDGRVGEVKMHAEIDGFTKQEIDDYVRDNFTAAQGVNGGIMWTLFPDKVRSVGRVRESDDLFYGDLQGLFAALKGVPLETIDLFDSFNNPLIQSNGKRKELKAELRKVVDCYMPDLTEVVNMVPFQRWYPQ